MKSQRASWLAHSESLLGLILSVISGALYFLAIPGVSSGIWIFFCWVPLLFAVESAPSLRRAAVRGFIAGAVGFGLGLNWLAYGISAVLRVNPFVALLVLVVIVCLQALAFVIAACAFGMLIRRGWPACAAVIAAILAGESLPQLVPYPSALALHAWPALMQGAAWAGPLAPALGIAGVNALVFELCRSGPLNRRGCFAGLAALVLSFWAFSGSSMIRATRLDSTSGETVTVAIIPSRVEARSRLEQPNLALDAYQTATRAALVSGRVEWVIWPETALAAPIPESSLPQVISYRLQGGYGVPLLSGAVLASSGGLYNSALSIGADGTVCGSCRHDKTLLVPFAEGDVGLRLADPSATADTGRFLAGEPATTMPVRIRGSTHQISVLICYEALSAAHARRNIGPAAELLVDLANDAWFDSSFEPEVHLAFLQLRAIEHRRSVVRAAAGGVNALIEADGSISARSNVDAPHALIGGAHWFKNHTIWWRFGYWPWFGLGLCVFVLADITFGNAHRATRRIACK